MSAYFHSFLCGREAAEWLIFMSVYIPLCISIGVLSIATICDICTHKIPNWLTFPALLAGGIITYHYFPDNIRSLSIFVFIMFIFGCMGISGWGDIKCVMAIAALNDWFVASVMYVAAQALLFVRYLVCFPNTAKKDFTDNAKQLATNTLSIDKTQPRHLLAPFLMFGYLAALSILYLITRYGGMS